MGFCEIRWQRRSTKTDPSWLKSNFKVSKLIESAIGWTKT
jgi:hypothetical protein